MGKIRAYKPRTRWTDAELHVLQSHYASVCRADLAALFPEREIRAVECKANALGLMRNKAAAKSVEETRAAKRTAMSRRRKENPEAVREYQRDSYQKNREKRLSAMREYQSRRFFWLRAVRINGLTAHDLASLWKRQRGLCGITGRRLTRQNAQVDHKIPKARGGSDEISNLRWACKEANLAKRDLTDAEFSALCRDVMQWIGERIALVEGL